MKLDKDKGEAHVAVPVDLMVFVFNAFFRFYEQFIFICVFSGHARWCQSKCFISGYNNCSIWFSSYGSHSFMKLFLLFTRNWFNIRVL